MHGIPQQSVPVFSFRPQFIGGLACSVLTTATCCLSHFLHRREVKHGSVQSLAHMVKVVSISILRWNEDTEEPVTLSAQFELSSFGFFQRSGVQQMLTFFSRTFAKRTAAGQRQTIQHEDYNCHVYRRADGLAGVVAADMDYPQRVAFVFLSKLMEEFGTEFAGRWEACTQDDSFANWPNLERAIQEYQDPTKADKITAIQKELDETTAVLHKTIDGVLERGVKLDQLVDKSNDLSNQSKMFYKQARKTNSCCVIC